RRRRRCARTERPRCRREPFARKNQRYSRRPPTSAPGRYRSQYSARRRPSSPRVRVRRIGWSRICTWRVLLALTPLLLHQLLELRHQGRPLGALAAWAPQQFLAAQEQHLAAGPAFLAAGRAGPPVEVLERQQLAPPERVRRRHAGDLRRLEVARRQ